jgi:hypothetical protein
MDAEDLATGGGGERRRHAPSPPRAGIADREACATCWRLLLGPRALVVCKQAAAAALPVRRHAVHSQVRRPAHVFKHGLPLWQAYVLLPRCCLPGILAWSAHVHGAYTLAPNEEGYVRLHHPEILEREQQPPDSLIEHALHGVHPIRTCTVDGVSMTVAVPVPAVSMPVDTRTKPGQEGSCRDGKEAHSGRDRVLLDEHAQFLAGACASYSRRGRLMVQWDEKAILMLAAVG